MIKKIEMGDSITLGIGLFCFRFNCNFYFSNYTTVQKKSNFYFTNLASQFIKYHEFCPTVKITTIKINFSQFVLVSQQCVFNFNLNYICTSQEY